MMTNDEFFELYYEMLPKFGYYYQAYNECERLHIEKFGRKKFSSPVVFRATLSRWHTKKPSQKYL
jgi:hypothetical protein